MSFTKVKIYNLALSALLLSRQIVDTESDINTNEVRVLSQFWDDALTSTLQQLDIDSMSEQFPLELIAQLSQDNYNNAINTSPTNYPNSPWTYVYKYPIRCAF